MIEDYTDDALDALGIIRLAQDEGISDGELDERFDALLDDRDAEDMVTLIWLLASLNANLANEWRRSVLELLPEDLHASVPTSAAFIQGLTDHLLRQELINA
jgi:hypothetical protein